MALSSPDPTTVEVKQEASKAGQAVAMAHAGPMAGKSGPSQVAVDGRIVKVTNLDKIMYPETGTTKGDVIGYYQAVAPWFVPHASGRPATRKRWVNGVGTADAPAHAFFHKNLDARSTPDWVQHRTIAGGEQADQRKARHRPPPADRQEESLQHGSP